MSSIDVNKLLDVIRRSRLKPNNKKNSGSNTTASSTIPEVSTPDATPEHVTPAATWNTAPSPVYTDPRDNTSGVSATFKPLTPPEFKVQSPAEYSVTAHTPLLVSTPFGEIDFQQSERQAATIRLNTFIENTAKAEIVNNRKPYTENDVRETYDAEGGLVNGNTQYKVNTVTTENYMTVSQNLAEDKFKLWLIEEGDSIGTVKYANRVVEGNKYTTSVTTIGADRLNGISENDKYVIYDPDTKTFYRYAQDASVNEKRRTSEAYVVQLNELTNQYQADVKPYMEDMTKMFTELNGFKNKAETTGLTDEEYAQYQAVFERYNKCKTTYELIYQRYALKYTSVLNKYNALTTELQGEVITGEEVAQYYMLRDLKTAFDNVLAETATDADLALLDSAYGAWGMPQTDIDRLYQLESRISGAANTVVYANEDYINTINAYTDTIRTEIEDYEKEASVYANYDSKTQVNSFLDVLKRMLSRVVWGQFQDTNVLSDLAELMSYVTVAPYKAAKSESNAINAVGAFTGVFLKNFFVNIAETGSVTEIFMPFIAGSTGAADGNYDDPNLNSFILAQAKKEFETLSPAQKHDWEPVGLGYGHTAVTEYAGWVATKAWLGAYGETPNFDYYSTVAPEERGFTTLIGSILVSLLFDPGLWIDSGKIIGKASALSDILDTNTVNKVLDNMYDTWGKAGATIINEAALGADDAIAYAQELASTGAIAIIRNKATDDVIINAYKKAFKRAINNGGSDRVMREAVTSLSKTVTDSMFSRAMRKTSDSAKTYLTGIAALDDVAKNAHKDALNAFTKRSTDITIEVMKNTAKTDGTVMAKLLYQTPKIVGIIHRLEAIEGVIGKTLLATAVPMLAVPVAAVRGIKKLLAKTTDLKKAKLAADAVSSISKHLSDAASTQHIYNASFGNALDETIKTISVLRANAGLSEDSYKFFKELESTVSESFIEYIVANDLKTIKRILTDASYDDIARINKLNEWAVEQGFESFKELNQVIDSNMVKFSAISPDVAAMYADYKRLYRNAIAAKNIAGTNAVMDNIYYKGVRRITEQFDAITQGYDKYVPLQNMHTTVQLMRDSFIDIVSDVPKEDYVKTANRLIAVIKNYGDGDEAKHIKELIATVDEFIALSNKYADGLNGHIGKIKAINYVQTPPTEYVAYITDKHKVLQRTHQNAIAEGIRKELQHRQGLIVTTQEIQENIIYSSYKEILFDEHGNLDLEGLCKIYQVQLDKYTKALQWTSDEAVQKIVDDVLDINTEVNCVLRNIENGIYVECDTLLSADEPDFALLNILNNRLDAIHNFLEQCAQQKHSRLLFENFENAAKANGVDERHINAVLDAMAGDKTHGINSAAKRFMHTRNSMYINNIVDTIVRDATEYLREISDTPIDYLWKRNCNTADTAYNVNRIAEEAKHVVPTDERFIDVYYSAVGTVRNANPHMISFKVEDAVHTFRNAESPFMLHDRHAKKMYGKTVKEVLEEYDKVCSTTPGMSKLEYIQNLQRYMLSLNKRATDEGKQLRFIGFNCGAATSEADLYIKDFFISNNIGVRWNSTIDVAEIIRKSKGMEYLADEDIMAIRKAVTDTLCSAYVNKRLHGVSGALVMDMEKPFVSAIDGVNMSIDDIASFMQEYAEDSERILGGLFDGIRKTKQTIDASGKLIGGKELGTLLSEREIANFIDTATMGKASSTRINNMRALYGTLSELKGATSGSFGLKKTLDMNNIKEWFDEDTLSLLLKADDEDLIISSHIKDLTDMVEGLDYHYQLVEYPELLEAIGVDAYRTVYDVLVTLLQYHPNMVGTANATLISGLKLTSAQDYYTALMYLRTKYHGMLDLDAAITSLRNLTDEGGTQSVDWISALLTLDDSIASAIVYNTDGVIHRFATQTNIVETKYASTLEQVVHTRAMMESAAEAAKDAQSFGTYLDLLDANYRAGGYYASEEHAKYILFSDVVSPYLELVDELNTASPKKHVDFAQHTPLYKATTIQAFDEAISDKIEALANLGIAHKKAAISAALTLSDADFENYVIRNCMNALVIDPNSQLFKGKLGVDLGYRLTDIINKGFLNVEHFTKMDADGNAHKYIRIYKDLSDFDLDKLLTKVWYTDVPLLHAYQKAFNGYLVTPPGGPKFLQHANQLYSKYIKKMANCMHDRYFGSTMEVLTQDTFAALQADFPEASRLHPGRIKNWFDESYNCSIWGDLSVQRMYNPYASDKIIENMGRGLHQVQHKMEATSNLCRLINSPQVSLRNMVTKVGLENADYRIIAKQLKERGYVLAVLKPNLTGGYTVTKLPLDSAHDFKKYMQDDTVKCLESTVYNHLNAATVSRNKLELYNRMHGNNVTGAMLDMYTTYMDTVYSADKTSKLLLSSFKGAGFRNVTDSTVKGTIDAGSDFIKHIGNRIEEQNSYYAICDAIVEKYHQVNSETIAKYFDEVTDTPIDEELFTELYVFNKLPSSDSTALYNIIKDSELPKMRALLGEDSAYTDSELKQVQKIFNYVHAKRKYANIPGELKYTVQTAMYKEVLEKLSKVYPKEQAEELAELFYHYTPTATTLGQQLEKIPLLGVLVSTDTSRRGVKWFSNAKMFSDAETRTRSALYLAYTREMGESVNVAEQRIIRSQFDYGNKTGLVGAIETLLPFSTFKIYNANYWISEAFKKYSTMHAASLMLRYTNQLYDAKQIATNIRDKHVAEAMAAQLENEQTGAEESATQWRDSILGYKGVSTKYAQGIPLGDNHVIKTGNSFVDALTVAAQLWYAPVQIAKGQLPSIIADNLYAPLAFMWNFLADYSNTDKINPTNVPWYNAHSAFSENPTSWLSENISNISDNVPVLGTLYNLVLTHIKHGVANFADFKAMFCDETLKKAYLHKLVESVIDGAGTIFPSIIGITYDPTEYFEREVGLNWSKNTSVEHWMTRINPETGMYYTKEEAEEAVKNYRSTHQYVYGVSNIPSFMGKDPATYINYAAMFIEWGFDEKDVKENIGLLLEQLYGGGFEQDAATNGVYFNLKGDGQTYLNFRLLNDTLAALAAKGYSIEQAIEYIKSEKWFDPYTGEVVKNTALYKAIANAAFLDVYEHLPEYVRYDKNQYSQLMAYWKAAGLNTQQAWMMMQSENGFIDEQGHYHVLTDEQAAQYTKQLNEDYYEFMDGLPDWYKYETGAATRTINYLIEKGMSKEDAYKYILNNNFYVDEDGNAHHLTSAECVAKTIDSSKEFEEYYSALPEYIKYEKGAYSRTLSYLKTIPGVDTVEAKQMIANGAYLTVDGRLINCLELQREYSFKHTAFLSEGEFKEYYQTLPNYIKYEKGAYKRTNAALKTLGFDYNTRLELIRQGAYLMPVDVNSAALDLRGVKVDANSINNIDDLLQAVGRKVIVQDGTAYTIVNCTNLVRMNARGSYYSNKAYNNYKRYTARAYTPKKYYAKKPYVTNKSYSSTYSKVNALSGASYGARKIYKVNLGNNPVRRSLSIKSAYPAAYRNIVYAHRRNMYKELYAKYGTSRMQMRANSAHSYSNASITRLRRNEIQNRMRYANRRSNF